MLDLHSPSAPHRSRTNHVLSSLTAEDAAVLAPFLQRIDLPPGQLLQHANAPVDHIYFLDRGFASVVGGSGEADAVQVGMIGREGFVGLPAALGARRSHLYVRMETAGSGHHAPAQALDALMQRSSDLRRSLLRCAHLFLLQVMRAAQINARGTLEARLVRWLLMAHDRVDGDRLDVTHHRLSEMLGVRRAGVSVAVKRLERRGLIAIERGALVIRKREDLEQSCDAYGAEEREAAGLR